MFYVLFFGPDFPPHTTHIFPELGKKISPQKVSKRQSFPLWFCSFQFHFVVSFLAPGCFRYDSTMFLCSKYVSCSMYLSVCPSVPSLYRWTRSNDFIAVNDIMISFHFVRFLYQLQLVSNCRQFGCINVACCTLTLLQEEEKKRRKCAEHKEWHNTTQAFLKTVWEQLENSLEDFKMICNWNSVKLGRTIKLLSSW